MSRVGIDQLLYLMDQAFKVGNHGLLNNLSSLEDNDWTWLPPGGGRSIFDIVLHLGECKYMYENHAFGDRSMQWGVPGTFPTVTLETPHEDVISWLRDGQRRLKASVTALESDDELLRPRRANWGQDFETRWLINATIQHDLYHGGEINHIRALHQGNDKWPYP